MSGAGFRQRRTGAAGRTGILFAILLAHGFLAAALLTMQVEKRASPERITYLVLPPPPVPDPPKQATPPESASPHDPIPQPLATAPVIAQVPAAHRRVPTTTAALREDRHAPCRPLRPGEKPQPGITCDTLQAPPSLVLPGSLHLDERGLPVPDRQDMFALLPPASSDQAKQDAERHFATLQQNFPKYEPHTMELWKSEKMDFCGCNVVLVGTMIGVEW